MVEGWKESTPDGFVISAKFPRRIVHGGQDAHPDARAILDRDAAYHLRDRFLEVMGILGPRLGMLLLQFPYFLVSFFPCRRCSLKSSINFLSTCRRVLNMGLKSETATGCFRNLPRCCADIKRRWC
jgi:uncharacterized protein YecE (DUF72 family)